MDLSVKKIPKHLSQSKPSAKYATNLRSNSKRPPKGGLFFGGLEEIRLHLHRVQIIVPLGPALAGSAHPRCN
jgi:hypothetical protein